MDKTYILLVEDDADDEALTLRALKKHHLANEVIVARDGAEALEHLFNPDRVLPQVVLLDLKLPKVDGIEVLRRIRASERTKHLPVVILTSSNEERDIWDSYSFGANSYVRKPVDFGEFSDAVGRLGLYWLLLNQVLPVRVTAPASRSGRE